MRGKFSLTAGIAGRLNPPGVCPRANVTAWSTKPRLTSTAALGVANEREYVKALWAALKARVAPGRYGAVQADALWSESERRLLRPGHFWIFEFGDAGEDKGSFEATFSLAPRSWKLHKGTRFYNGEAALVVKRWFHRADDDVSGCTFVEWDPAKDAAPGAPPVALLINSTRLRDVFGSSTFRAVTPPALASRTTRQGAAVLQLEGLGVTRFVLQQDRDSSIRDRCVQAGSVLS